MAERRLRCSDVRWAGVQADEPHRGIDVANGAASCALGRTSKGVAGRNAPDCALLRKWLLLRRTAWQLPSFRFERFARSSSAHDRSRPTSRPTSAHIHTSCDFVQALMKLQRAAQLITSVARSRCAARARGQRYRRIDRLRRGLGVAARSRGRRHGAARRARLHGLQEGRALGSGGAAWSVTSPRPASCAMPATCASIRTTSRVSRIRGRRSSVPLKLDGEVIGVLSVDHKQTERLLRGPVAGHSRRSPGTSRWRSRTRGCFADERMERERMQHEAEEARAVQQALFVKAVPLLPGFAFETAWNPAGTVAGTGSTSSISAMRGVASCSPMSPARACRRRC